MSDTARLYSIDFILNILYNVSTFIKLIVQEMYVEFDILSLDISLDLSNLYR